MKNKIVLFITLIVLLINHQTSSVFAYDDKTTHPALTDEIVDFYNSLHLDKPLTSEQKEWIVEGSILEDTSPRWINHFYDPIYKVGWTGENAGAIEKEKVQEFSQLFIFPAKPVSSLEWMHNDELQAQYAFYKGSRTWNRGILEMIKSNEKEGYEILGHILHLIEDASVPEHTRNDTHAHEAEGITGDFGSPFEDYLTKYTRQNIKRELNIANNLKKENLYPPQKSSVDDYLISLAEYSNKYFFSKDTINDQKYQNPKIIREDENFEYGIDEVGKEFPLARVADAKTNKVFLLDKNDEVILDAYFSRLSRHAVLSGAGVIALFEKEFQIKKEYPVHAVAYDPSPFNYFQLPSFSLVSEWSKIQNTTQSFFSQVASSFSNSITSIGNFWTGIFGTQNNLKLASEILISDSSSSGLLSSESPSPSNVNNSSDFLNQNSQANSNASAKPEIVSGKKPGLKNQTIFSDNQDEEAVNVLNEKSVKNSTTTEGVFVGQTSASSTALSQPAVLKECRFNTSQQALHQKVIINEVAWMGSGASANNEWIELKNISGGETDLKNWQLIDKDEQIKITFEPTDGFKIMGGGFLLLERTNDNAAPTVPADLIYAGALSNTNEGLRLFDNQCNLVDEVLVNPDWPAGDNSVSSARKTMERDSAGFGWHTSAMVGGTPKAENSVVYSSLSNNVNSGGGGGGAISLPQPSSPSSPAKILISEIQTTGGPGKTDYDFIEIYNSNNTAVNLNGYRLVKRTKTGTSDTNIKSWTNDVFIPAGGYYLWANSNYSGIPTAPDGITSVTIANDNGVAIRFGPEDTGTIIDSVAWGEAQNAFIEGAVFASNPGTSQSIQRKIQGSGFLDTQNNANDFEIKSCHSPGGRDGLCPAGAVSLVPSPINLTDHLVISEVQVAGDKAEDEFIEIYNPTAASISLSNYSIQYLSGRATSTERILKRNFPEASEIPAGRFFLLVNSGATSSLASRADLTYSSFSLSGERTGGILFLASSTSVVQDINDLNIADRVAFGEVAFAGISTSSAPAANQSLERKAYSENCAAPFGVGEFLGNSCDTDGAGDFILRITPRPQSLANLKEPRDKPFLPHDIASSFTSTTMKINLAWQADQDYAGNDLVYEGKDISATSSVVFSGASSTTALFIGEVGRDYIFSLESFDKDGLGSGAVSTTIAAPSFFDNLYFYRLFATSTDYIVEGYYPGYPFVPDLFRKGQWRVLVFYLNSDPLKGQVFTEGTSPSMEPANSVNILPVKYKRCSGGSISTSNSLILPDSQYNCGTAGGAMNSALDFRELEDNHFLIQTNGVLGKNFTSADYITVAYYTTFDWSMGRGSGFQLAAVDKKKYYFEDLAPSHQSPELTSPLNLVFDKPNSRIRVSWDKARDGDTIDDRLVYEINVSSSTDFAEENWKSVDWHLAYERFVAPGDSFEIGVRARDDFQNVSNILSSDFTYPAARVLIAQDQITDWSNNFGNKGAYLGCPDAASLQSIAPLEDISFDNIVLRIRQSRVSEPGNLRLSVYPSLEAGRADFDNKISESIVRSVFHPDENQDIAFIFSPTVQLLKDRKYWLALDVESYDTTNAYEAYGRNRWQNAISKGSDLYALGEAGARKDDCSFQIPSPDASADWYMKIGGRDL